MYSKNYNEHLLWLNFDAKRNKQQWTSRIHVTWKRLTLLSIHSQIPRKPYILSTILLYINGQIIQKTWADILFFDSNMIYNSSLVTKFTNTLSDHYYQTTTYFWMTYELLYCQKRNKKGNSPCQYKIESTDTKVVKYHLTLH